MSQSVTRTSSHPNCSPPHPCMSQSLILYIPVSCSIPVFPQRIRATQGRCSGYYCQVANYSRTLWLKTTTVLLCSQDQWVRTGYAKGGFFSAVWCPDRNWEGWKAGVAWKLGARISLISLHSLISCLARMAWWPGVSEHLHLVFLCGWACSQLGGLTYSAFRGSDLSVQHTE